MQCLCSQAKFGGVQELAEQGKKPGDVAILKRGQRHIYYLVTKVSSLIFFSIYVKENTCFHFKSFRSPKKIRIRISFAFVYIAYTSSLKRSFSIYKLRISVKQFHLV